MAVQATSSDVTGIVSLELSDAIGVFATLPGPGPSFHATSFFECDATGKIVAITEYWATDEEPPEWRRAGGWAERL